MSSARLFVLGVLARRGPMHGHQIRRSAQIDHLDLWTDVKPGSLYGVLQRMDGEGLVRQLRVEQEGKRPPRTVYEITEDGRHELEVLRARTLRDGKLIPDPVDLALGQVPGMREETARAALTDRRSALAHQLQTMRHLRAEADPYLGAMEKHIFEHTIRRLQLDIDWLDEILSQLPQLTAEPEGHGQ
ncbi:PadR family transcriptional regulator [Nocardia harenae]|uniref:PadR family transcriptional regulator n=1 Tax=Nocardia harenae TaxID=358707 RepID=UPI0012ED9012|nr:PadR family transcriptional regulator [Nocardia harenae]